MGIKNLVSKENEIKLKLLKNKFIFVLNNNFNNIY